MIFRIIVLIEYFEILNISLHIQLSFFLAFRGNNERFSAIFRCLIYIQERGTTIAVAIVERTISIWKALQKKTKNEPMYKTDTKNQAKRCL